jgi:anti-sigma regulatory factor (Ser/Thr protein kinase)
LAEIELEAVVENLASATEFVTNQLEGIRCSMGTQMQIELAVDEIFTNICMYAYAPDTGKAVISVDTDTPGIVKLTFTDSGIPYNPLEKEDPDVTLPLEQRSIGGLGIFLVRKNVDDMRYTRQNGQNILTVLKQI